MPEMTKLEIYEDLVRRYMDGLITGDEAINVLLSELDNDIRELLKDRK